jgi:hypothetical protein
LQPRFSKFFFKRAGRNSRPLSFPVSNSAVPFGAHAPSRAVVRALADNTAEAAEAKSALGFRRTCAGARAPIDFHHVEESDSMEVIMTAWHKWIFIAASASILFRVFIQFFEPIGGRSDHRIASRCHQEMTGFIMGIKAYQTEYNRLPIEVLTSTDPKVPSITRGKIIDTLYPYHNASATESNPRKIDFYIPRAALNQKDGLYTDEKDEPVLVDPWGTPFYYSFDQSGEGKVPNLDPRDNKEHPFLETTVIMFSAGPDKNPDTWDDNVMTWK